MRKTPRKRRYYREGPQYIKSSEVIPMGRKKEQRSAIRATLKSINPELTEQEVDAAWARVDLRIIY